MPERLRCGLQNRYIGVQISSWTQNIEELKMQSFQEFVLTEGNELSDRNKFVDISAIVKKKALA